MPARAVRRPTARARPARVSGVDGGAAAVDPGMCDALAGGAFDASRARGAAADAPGRGSVEIPVVVRRRRRGTRRACPSSSCDRRGRRSASRRDRRIRRPVGRAPQGVGVETGVVPASARPPRRARRCRRGSPPRAPVSLGVEDDAERARPRSACTSLSDGPRVDQRRRVAEACARGAPSASTSTRRRGAATRPIPSARRPRARPSPPRVERGRSRVRQRGERLVEHVDRVGEQLVGDREARQEAQHVAVGARGQHQHAVLGGVRRDLADTTSAMRRRASPGSHAVRSRASRRCRAPRR